MTPESAARDKRLRQLERQMSAVIADIARLLTTLEKLERRLTHLEDARRVDAVATNRLPHGNTGLNDVTTRRVGH